MKCCTCTFLKMCYKARAYSDALKAAGRLAPDNCCDWEQFLGKSPENTVNNEEYPYEGATHED